MGGGCGGDGTCITRADSDSSPTYAVYVNKGFHSQTATTKFLNVSSGISVTSAATVVLQ